MIAVMFFEKGVYVFIIEDMTDLRIINYRLQSLLQNPVRAMKKQLLRFNIQKINYVIV